MAAPQKYLEELLERAIRPDVGRTENPASRSGAYTSSQGGRRDRVARYRHRNAFVARQSRQLDAFDGLRGALRLFQRGRAEEAQEVTDVLFGGGDGVQQPADDGELGIEGRRGARRGAHARQGGRGQVKTRLH